MMELNSLLIFCMMLGGNHIVNNPMDCVSVVTNIAFSSFFPFLIECALSPRNLTFPLFYHGGNWNILSLMRNPTCGGEIMELSYLGQLMIWHSFWSFWKRARRQCWINFMILCRDFVWWQPLLSLPFFRWLGRISGSS